MSLKRIGLVRHFRVTYVPDRKWMTSEQFDRWVEMYNSSGIDRENRMSGEYSWDVCLCSDQSRAAETARIVYKGPIMKMAELREIGIRSIGRSKIKLHYTVWLALARLAWLFSHKSQEESREGTRSRAKRFVDIVEAEYPVSSVLVVSHGAFMKAIAQELARRGYRGKGFIKPANGKLYTYERLDTPLVR